MKKFWIWLRVFIPVYPFLFLEIDHITKNHALAAGKYTLSPHFLLFAIPIEILIGLEVILIALFGVFWCIPWVLWRTRFSYMQYLYGDFPAHMLVVGSVLSNTYDLIRRGGIIDWIDLGIIKTNFADIGIIGGICIVVWRYSKTKSVQSNFL